MHIRMAIGGVGLFSDVHVFHFTKSSRENISVWIEFWHVKRFFLSFFWMHPLKVKTKRQIIEVNRLF